MMKRSMLALVVADQATRGFFPDALGSIESMTVPGFRDSAQTIVGVRQAEAGDFAEARRTLLGGVDANGAPRFSSESHATLIGLLATAGRLDEAYAEAVMMTRRPADASLNEDVFEDVLIAFVKAGQASRAFDLAARLSKYDRGNSWYYLVIAEALGPAS